MSQNGLTLVYMCHQCLQQSEIQTNIPPMSLASVQVWQLTPNYIRAKCARTNICLAHDLLQMSGVHWYYVK